MSESLGKASLDLEANLAPFEKNMKAGEKTADSMKDSLDAIAKVAIVAEIELNKVKMQAANGAKSREVSATIERSVGRVGAAAMAAADHLDRVKLGAAQAEETTVVGDIIDRKLRDITGNANETRRSLESVRLAGAAAAGAGNPGAGVGPFGSGFGRIGLLGTAVGAGTLLAPAAGPALLGLLGAIPVLATAAVGAVGVLALALGGVGKAIGGDKKAFDKLNPSAQQFVLTIRSLSGWFDKLKETAAASLFPGLTTGLKAALSPGTLGAITVALEEFGHAIGDAGVMWGRYFGSAEFQSIFVPLMHAGAHELTLMSTSALALFDAFGILGRAAIPFTTWLMQAIANGSKLADAWLHAQDASGGLARGMNEAQVSLRLVGELLLSVGRAVAALGVALYPVSKIAVKDLTDGFNGLALIIRRNQDVIREVIATALSALVGAVKVVVDAIKLLNEGLGHIVGEKSRIVIAIAAIGIALALWLGPYSVAIAGVILAVGMIQQHWQAFSEWIVKTLKWVAEKIGGVFSLIPSWINPTLHNVGVSMQSWAESTGTNMGQSMGSSFTKAFQGSLDMKSLTSAGFNTDLMTGGSLRQFGDVTFTGKDLKGVKTAFLDSLSQAVKDMGGDQVASIEITSAKRPPGPSNDVTNSNHITGDAVDGYVVLKNGKKIPLGTYIKSIAGAYGLRSGDVPGFDPKTPGGYDAIHVDDGANVGGAGGSIPDPFGAQPDWTKNLPKAPKMPTIVTGTNLIPSAINDRIAKFASIAQNSAGKVAEAALEKEQRALLEARDAVTGKLKGASAAQRAEIRSELTDLEGKLRDVHKAITDNLAAQKKAVQDAITAVKSRFAGQVSTVKQTISSMFSRIEQDLTAALQEKFQGQIAALGAQFFQNGALTPTEQALANMAADDARAQAYATGDPRQIAQYELGLIAARERAQADKDYAAQLAVLQHQQQLEQQQLTDELARFSVRVQDGTANLSDLNGILKPFGLSIDDIPADQLTYDMDNLSLATQTLAQVMLAEAVALAKLGDSKDARSAAKTAQDLLDNGFAGIDPGWDAGIAAALAAPYDSSDVISRMMGRIPKLDVGGNLLSDGLIYGHQGETVVPASVAAFRGGGDQQAASVRSFSNELELGLFIGRLMQKANKSGIKFELV